MRTSGGWSTLVAAACGSSSAGGAGAEGGASAAGGTSAAAGSGPGGAGGGQPTLPTDQSCDALSTSECAKYDTCAPDLVKVIWGDQTTCKSRLKIDCLSRANLPDVGATPATATEVVAARMRPGDDRGRETDHVVPARVRREGLGAKPTASQAATEKHDAVDRKGRGEHLAFLGDVGARGGNLLGRVRQLVGRQRDLRSRHIERKRQLRPDHGRGRWERHGSSRHWRHERFRIWRGTAVRGRCVGGRSGWWFVFDRWRPSAGRSRGKWWLWRQRGRRQPGPLRLLGRRVCRSVQPLADGQDELS